MGVLTDEEVKGLTALLMKRLDWVCDTIGEAPNFSVMRDNFASDDGYGIPCCIDTLRDYVTNIVGRANRLNLKCYGLIGVLIMTYFDVNITPIIFNSGVYDDYETSGYYVVSSHTVSHLTQNLFENFGGELFNHYLEIFMQSLIDPYAHRKGVNVCNYDDEKYELIVENNNFMALVFRLDDVVFDNKI